MKLKSTELCVEIKESKLNLDFNWEIFLIELIINLRLYFQYSYLNFKTLKLFLSPTHCYTCHSGILTDKAFDDILDAFSNAHSNELNLRLF